MDSKKLGTLLVTGSSGLIGSEAVKYFDDLGWEVHGIDNNMRADFFGPDGDTTWNLNRLKGECKNFTHHNIDIRDREAVSNFYFLSMNKVYGDSPNKLPLKELTTRWEYP